MSFLKGIFRALRGQTQTPDPNANGNELNDVLFSDEPITERDQDLLNRSEVIQRLARAVAAWPENQPLVLAITAPWGEGKTSVLNLLTDDFRTREYLIVEFDPWFFNSEEGLIQGFLSALEKRLLEEPEFRGSRVMKGTWQGVRRTLSSLPTVSMFGFGVDFANVRQRVPGIDDLRAAIRDISQKLRRRVVVTLDDLDRLSP
ncbi:MAG: P-loop NTPase fold protein, partial [Dehalococcoidia bacterium]